MEKLETVYDRFALCQDEIEFLREQPVELVRYAPARSSIQGVYLAAGASLAFGKLVAIKLPWQDRVTAWPLWSVERKCAFVIGFRWDSSWQKVGWIAEDTRFFLCYAERHVFARTDKAWTWAGFADLALDDSWLEDGAPILNRRFRTSYPFVATKPEQLHLPA